MAKKLTELFHCMWVKEAIPQKFKDTFKIHVYKQNGNVQVCDNYRGISLLSIAGKILAKVLLNRLNEYLDQAGLLAESRFRKDRGTINMVFKARQLREMSRTKCRPLHDLCHPHQYLSRMKSQKCVCLYKQDFETEFETDLPSTTDLLYVTYTKA